MRLSRHRLTCFTFSASSACENGLNSLAYSDVGEISAYPEATITGSFGHFALIVFASCNPVMRGMICQLVIPSMVNDDPRAPYKVYEGDECKGTYATRAEARRAQQRLAEAQPERNFVIMDVLERVVI